MTAAGGHFPAGLFRLTIIPVRKQAPVLSLIILELLLKLTNIVPTPVTKTEPTISTKVSEHAPLRAQRSVGYVIFPVTKKKTDIRIIESDTAGVSERTPAPKKVSERTRRVQGA